MAFLAALPYIAAGASVLGAGHSIYSQHRSNRRASRGKYGAPSEGKIRGLHQKQDKDYKKSLRSFRKGEGIQQQLSKRNLDILKKFGGEAYNQYPRLNQPQTSLLEKLNQFSQGQLSPIQNMPLYQQATGNLMDLLSRTPEAYERFKEPTMQEYQREILPQLIERFRGVGALSSSGFQNALAQSGEQLGYKLGALRAGLQQSALDRALGYSAAPYQQGVETAGLGLGTEPFYNVYRPPSFANTQMGTPPQAPTPYQRPPSAASSFFGQAAPGIGQGLGSAVGAGLTSGLGNIFSNLFKGGGASKAAPVPGLNTNLF